MQENSDQHGSLYVHVQMYSLYQIMSGFFQSISDWMSSALARDRGASQPPPPPQRRKRPPSKTETHKRPPSKPETHRHRTTAGQWRWHQRSVQWAALIGVPQAPVCVLFPFPDILMCLGTKLTLVYTIKRRHWGWVDCACTHGPWRIKQAGS